VKIVDFSWNATGPIAARNLALHGATVVRIESGNRNDLSRFAPPYADGTPGLNRSTFWTEFNINKYGMALNLNHPRGIEVAEKLVAWGDIVVESFRVGQMEKWGLHYDRLRKIKPDLIMFSTSMQGQTGPRAKNIGVGNVLVGMSGFNQILGYPGEGPLQPYGAYTDWMATRFGTIMLMAALEHRRRTGRGQYIDMSQYEASNHFLSPLFLDFQVNGRIAGREGNRCSYAAPHGVYPCRGHDRWCAIAVFSDEQWKGLCEVIGRPELCEDPRFETLLDRKQNEEALDRVISEWTSMYGAEEAMRRVQAAGVAAGVVATGEDLFNDPQLTHRQAFKVMDHPEIGRHAANGIGYNLSETPAEYKTSGPCLGQHTEYVCTKFLGMNDEEFIQLLSDGVFE
jgi:crotonobetainyl-CoA:carnitine CoA-transferase CaiB-like acyl-CoA transferase